jgi:hypothetical protein
MRAASVIAIVVDEAAQWELSRGRRIGCESVDF